MADATFTVPLIPRPGAAAPSGSAPRIDWVAPPQSWVGLSLLNTALRILTLGLYHFWGKTEVRQRIWSAVRVNGEPLEYRGTGGELLRGFLVVFFLILLPISIIGFVVPFAVKGHPAAEGSYNIGAWVFLLTLTGVGVHRARRYRLSRTTFRGIRGGLAGRSRGFAWTYFWTMALVPLTLGWLYPYRSLVLYRELTNASRFGDTPFEFHGKSSALYRRFWLVWVGGIALLIGVGAVIASAVGPDPKVTAQAMTGAKVARIIGALFGAYFLFGLLYAWYAAGRLNYFAAHTKLAGASFKLRATVPSLIWLTASNFVLRFLTLGILSPVAEARSMRYIVERLSIEGEIPWDRISQNPDQLLKRGEGLAEALNVDAF